MERKVYKDRGKKRKEELKNAVCKLDFIDFEKACDLLANYLDFLQKLCEQFPDKIKDFTPTYEYTRALLGGLLHDEKTSDKFKYIVLNYLKNFYYKNKIKSNESKEKPLPKNVIKFPKT